MKKSAVVILLHRIVNQMDRETARLAGAEKLTLSQFAVLEALYHKGCLSVGEVKRLILSSDGTIPVVVRNLVKAGLILRREDPEDHRRCLLELTEKGRDVIDPLCAKNQEMLFSQLEAAWSPEEIRQLLILLQKFPLGE
ncbi:MarR family winged helix-turn-helix transcriptional regulator [Acidaminococcus timonensis]|uniref:MarR family winged helix-turn-helix transcriptional regulator n=1 Tax=Acidaminococcus timonensis TaxID=1871002 RepID=UPI0026F3252E|nr:MarR family transcriptional regulator [Acidaminococcus timonensis]